MLLELGGYEVFERTKGIPTIFLTARDGLSDRVKGLTLSAVAVFRRHHEGDIGVAAIVRTALAL